MTGLEIIILIAVIALGAAVIGTYLTSGQPALKDMEQQPDKPKFEPRKVTTTQTQAVEHELYDKDLRPIVGSSNTKQDKPSLTQSAQQLVKEIEKVANIPTTQEQSQQLAKDLVNIATQPAKSKNKRRSNKKA